MITTSPEHLALLKSRTFFAADLYEFVLIDGTVLRYTSGAISTAWNGQVFQSGGPVFERGEIRIAAGLEADELTLTAWPREGNLLLGLSWAAAACNGAFDGATVTAWRAHSAGPGRPVVGAVRLFGGSVGNVDIGVEEGIKIPVQSDMAVLDRKIPRAVFQPGCDRTLYDKGCGLSRASHQINGNAQGGSDALRIVTSLSDAAGTYSGGEVRIITGVSAGARRTIKRHADGGVLLLAYPLPRGVMAGDAFQLWPGCNRTYAACQAFGNTPRFRGEPFIPAPETAY